MTNRDKVLLYSLSDLTVLMQSVETYPDLSCPSLRILCARQCKGVALTTAESHPQFTAG